MLSRYNEPRTFKEAWNHPDHEEQVNWPNAIKKEFNDMMKQGVWKRIPKTYVTKGRTLIGNKWVFKKKKNGIYWARLVALGYSQVPGVDFTENYALVINDITMRVIVVLMLSNEWYGEIIDMETAFLYGELQEEIYMTIPSGLNKIIGQDLQGECVTLKKSIYGLVQAAHAWWIKFTNSLRSKGFVKSQADSCLMLQKNDDRVVILCIYVDDVCCIGDRKAVTGAINNMESIYSIKKIREQSKYIRVNIKNEGDMMYLSQQDSIKRLKKHLLKVLNT